MIDIQACYGKLANEEPLSEQQTVDLLKELAHFRDAAAYLASCQAATFEGLTKSTSKSERRRHREICEVAAKLLNGDVTAIRYKTSIADARERCLRVVANVDAVQT